jgi:hypothetical protein
LSGGGLAGGSFCAADNFFLRYRADHDIKMMRCRLQKSLGAQDAGLKHRMAYELRSGGLYVYMEGTSKREAEERERAAAAEDGSDSDGNGTDWIAADRLQLGMRKKAREKQKILSAMEMGQENREKSDLWIFCRFFYKNFSPRFFSTRFL